MSDHEKLDNPVWYSLSEVHKNLSIDYHNVKFYDPEYCPFGSFIESDDVASPIDEYSKLVNNFFVVGEKPPFSNRIFLKKELVCLQMILEKRIETIPTEKIIKLDNTWLSSLLNLVNEVQPDYFKRKTNLMGDYFGIVKEGKLVAVTGERMRMNDLTEVSAVVTHPSYAGRAYAKQLVSHTTNKIFDENKIPFLHVAEVNIGAIRLYEKLGFTTRRKISFWNLETNLKAI